MERLWQMLNARKSLQLDTCLVLGNILWIALLGVLAWALIRWFNRQPGFPGSRESGTFGSSPSALEILRQRYARGEIDATTFEQMRERLSASETPEAKREGQKQPTMNGR